LTSPKGLVVTVVVVMLMCLCKTKVCHNSQKTFPFSSVGKKENN